MTDSHAILKQVNWFLEPVKDFVFFLFTSSSGYILMIVALVLYILFGVANSLQVRRLQHEAVSRNSRPSGIESLYLIFSEIAKTFLNIVAKIPVLLGVLLLLFLLAGVSAGLSSIDDFLSNEKKIKELQKVVKNLDKDYTVAKIEITDVDYKEKKTALKVFYYDYARKSYLPDAQDIAIPGTDIYILNYVMNFEYSEIESGRKRNLVFPYKIFSEELPKDKGIALKYTDEDGIPYIFKRNTQEVYGLDSLSYAEGIREIAALMQDPKKAREAGVRSFYAAAPHHIKMLYPGLCLILSAEQTGGLVIRQEKAF